MIFTIEGHSYEYETRNILSIFLRNEKVIKTDHPEQSASRSVRSYLIAKGNRFLAGAELHWDEKTIHKTRETSRRDECERLLCACLYDALSELTGLTSRWGLLTGIRPVKMIDYYTKRRRNEEEIVELLEQDYLVSKEKARLCIETYRREKNITDLSQKNSFSLYLSIPFCPTRCRYCSFVSHSVEKASKLIDPYLDCLVAEIKATADAISGLGLRLETVYIGGGTPTTLDRGQLKRLLDAVNDGFDLSTMREYTCEAGRPDTVDEGKLETLAKGGVTRVSINPQTMDDRVLQNIGRRHTALETLKAYEMARKSGFRSINMDVIAGLPGDTVEGFQATLRTLNSLGPENITVHTLSLKRAAALASEGDLFDSENDAETAEMVDFSYRFLTDNSYYPYYLYRQKNTKGNLENVSYTKEGFDGLYNVFIMSEVHSIVALGAGGVTKLFDPVGGRIERIFNHKYPYEYISRFEEVLERKKKTRLLLQEQMTACS